MASSQRRQILHGLLASATVVYLFASFAACSMALHPPRRSLQPVVDLQQVSTRNPSAVITNATIVASDGAELRGWLMRPAHYEGKAVIILHGVADNRLSAAGFAQNFLPAGYAVLLSDSRAHGESGGAFASYGVLERDDVHRWIDWLDTAAAPQFVYVLGESMGAAIAIQATAADPRICATVAESSFATFREVAYERVGQIIGTGPWLGKTLARPAIELALLGARMRTGVSLAAASPLQAIQKTKTPVLLIHGAADTNISPSNSRNLFKAARDHAALWIVPGAGHCGASSVQPQEFHRRVLGWFESHPAKH